MVTASTFPRWEGDTEPRFVLDLSKHMTDEFEVTVLVPAALGAEEEEYLEGVHVIRYHYFPVHRWETLCYPGAIIPRIKEKKIRALLVPFLFLAFWWNLMKRLPEFDVVHAHWMIPQGIVQSFFKKPYIVTGHGGDVTSLNKGIFRKLKIRCLRKANQVTVVSGHLKNVVKELDPEIEPAVIPMGVDTSRFGRKYYVRDYFGQGDKKVVLFVGRLVEIKGVRYLIEAMKQIDAVLVIVGDGPLKENLQTQASVISDKVIFLGAKTHEELKTVFASSDVFVAPSVTTEKGEKEGFGLVLLEAMASGLPVVANNSGGIPQLVKDNVNGLLCEEKNVAQLVRNICSLMEDEALHKRIVAGGEKTAEEYDYATVSRKYKKYLKNSVT